MTRLATVEVESLEVEFELSILLVLYFFMPQRLVFFLWITSSELH